MALRAVPDHPKFADLKQRLGRSKGATLGYLECVWHFTGRFTPQGNIGKYADAAIEAWVEWDGEPGALIEGLIEAKWLDRDSEHRVLVHDWENHADKATKQSLKRLKLEFCVPTVCTVREKLAEIRTTVHTPGAHNDVLSALPVPVPVPVPVPEPEPDARRLPTPIRTLPANYERRIRVLADQCPDQQDLQFGVDMAVQELLSAINPESTIAAMEENLPLWWEAMRNGRAKIKQFRWVIKDTEYLKKPREPTKRVNQAELQRQQIVNRPNPRLFPGA